MAVKWRKSARVKWHIACVSHIVMERMWQAMVYTWLRCVGFLALTVIFLNLLGGAAAAQVRIKDIADVCLLYTSPSPRDS